MADSCPQCGISMEEIQNIKRLEAKEPPKEKNNNTHSQKGKRMIFIFSAVFILLVLGIVFLISNNIFSKKAEDISVSEPLLSEEPENVLPTITGQGAEPFILGQSIMNIPPKGKFYDTILLSKHYGVIEGDHYLVIDENEIDDYYKTMGSDYFDPDAFMGTAVVISDGDTLMVVSFNESGTIDNIEIISSILSLDNGIHVGLASTEMFSKYNADFLTTDCFSGESFQIYHIPGQSENITLFATMNGVDGASWYYDNISDDYEPDRTIFKCVKEEKNGFSALYKVPLNYVRNCSIKKIDITPNGREGFNLK